MNEDQKLSQLFQRIETQVRAGDGLRRSIRENLRVRRRTKFVVRLTAVGGCVAACVLVAATLFLIPASSAAASFRRIGAALRLKSMHVRSYYQRPREARRMFSEMFYANGSWRIDMFPGLDLSRNYIRAGGKQWLYLAHSDVSVGEPQLENAIDEAPTALDFAKLISDEGDIIGERDYKIEPRPDEGGRTVYAVLGSRKGTPYHLEMIVDKATDLPIRSSFSGEEPGSVDYELLTETYTYDDFPTDHEFSPQIRPTTRVLDLPVETTRLKELWMKPIESYQLEDGHKDLRSLSVNDRGDLFMVFSSGTGPSSRPDHILTWSLFGSSLEDDLGRKYELVTSMRPGATFGDTNARHLLTFGSDEVELLEWAPVQPTTPWISAKSIQYSIGDSGNQIEKLPLPAVLSTPFPAYDDALMLGQIDAQFEMRASEMRARSAEVKNDHALAARWFFDAGKHAFPRTWAKRYEAYAAKSLKKIENPVP